MANLAGPISLPLKLRLNTAASRSILSWEHFEEPLGYDEYDEYDGQPDEAQEWYDFDPDC